MSKNKRHSGGKLSKAARLLSTSSSKKTKSSAARVLAEHKARMH